MKIVDVYEKTLNVGSPMRNAFIDFNDMTLSIAIVVTDTVVDGERLVGYGFSSPGRYGQAGIIRERLIPRLLAVPAKQLLDDEGVIDPTVALEHVLAGEKPGGHGDVAVAASVLDIALWDLASKARRLPLHEHLAAKYNPDGPDERVWTYAAGGYYRAGAGVEDLVEEMQQYLEQGYEAVKLKIGGIAIDEDICRYHQVCDAVGGAQSVAVDANARLNITEALEYANALGERPPRWYEEPGDPLDYSLMHDVADIYDAPLATGENLFSAPDAKNLLLYAGLRADRDVLQFDPGLSYGVSGYLRIVDVVEAHGWSRRNLIPHGGHQLNLCVASGLGLGGTEVYPGVFAPIGGLADNVKISPEGATPSSSVGIGIEHKADLLAAFEALSSKPGE